MTDEERTDGWETLRRRLEQSSGARWRGTWVPTRPAASDYTPDDASPEPGAVPLPELPAARHSLRPAHLGVVVLVTAAALVGTMLVLASAQPQTQQVDLSQDVATEALTATPGPPQSSPAQTTQPVAQPTGLAEPALSAEPSPLAEVVVHVAGKVRRPGVVRLPVGSRVVDAVEAAGGALPKAELATVNLAQVLTDGEQVRVGLAAAESAPGAPDPVTGTAPDAARPVNLNQASAAELEELPGVGPVLAGRIVAYRVENGPFRSVDQLIEVPGIGPAVLSGLVDQVQV